MTFSIERAQNYFETLDTLGAIPVVGTLSAAVLRIPTGIALLVCFAARNFFFKNSAIKTDRILEASLYQFIAFAFEVIPLIGLIFHLHINNGTTNLRSNTAGKLSFITLKK